MKQTTNFNEYNIVGDDSSLTINNSSGSLVSFTNGNVGIGTTSPLAKLHVTDNVIIDATSSGERKGLQINTMRVNDDSSSGVGVIKIIPVSGDVINSFSFTTGGAIGNTFFNPSFAIKHTFGSLIGSVLSEINTDFMLNTTATGVPYSAMRFMGQTGKVGIGNTNPIERLDVNGNIKADGILKLYDVTDTQKIELNPDGDSYINGNVGIGTALPNAKMHIKLGDSGATPISQQHLILEHNSATGLGILTTSATSGYIFFGDETNAQIGYIGYSHPTDSMIFKIAGSERIRIDSSGNVGINTTLPTEKFEVNGNIKSSGYINGKRCGAAGYLAAPVNITVTTANTYYPIGVFTVPVAADFIVGTTYPNGLKYTGTIAQTFHITWNATIESTSNNVSSIIDIEKNGVSIPMAKMGTYSKTGGEIYNLNGQCVVDLDVNDEIRFVVTANNNGEILTFDYFTASIKEFFD